MEDIVFDRAGVMTRVGNDVALLKELFELFFSDYSRALGSLEEAQQKQDLKRLKSEAHAIKSALGNLGANRAYSRAQSLERSAASGSPGQSELEQLKLEVQAFKTAIAEFLS